MSFRKYIAIASLSAAIIAPAVSFAATPSSGCIFREHQVASVKPYRVDEHIGRVVVNRLRGAELFVPAKPGVTAEWLRASMQRHLQQMSAGSMKGCPLDVRNVRVDVASAGTGFYVRVVAKDTKSANEILRRAQLLVG